MSGISPSGEHPGRQHPATIGGPPGKAGHRWAHRSGRSSTSPTWRARVARRHASPPYLAGTIPRPPAPAAVFALAKWYLDLVTDDGRALVAYAARLQWGPIRLVYSALLRSAPGSPPVQAASIRRGQPPHHDGDVITWRSAPLGLTGAWRADSTPLGATLLETEAGRIEWNCRMPRAQAHVACGDERWTGRGYVETLTLTIPPNRLPFRILRWGRHLSSRHAVVWIEWEGGTNRRWVWLDGTVQPAARLTPVGLDLGDGRAIRFSVSRDLRTQDVEANLSPITASVRRRLAGMIGTMHEHKLLSRSTLVGENGVALDDGWAIHEEVTW